MALGQLETTDHLFDACPIFREAAFQFPFDDRTAMDTEAGSQLLLTLASLGAIAGEQVSKGPLILKIPRLSSFTKLYTDCIPMRASHSGMLRVIDQ